MNNNLDAKGKVAYVGLDFETTGLNVVGGPEATDVPLEIGVAFFDQELNVLYARQALIAATEDWDTVPHTEHIEQVQGMCNPHAMNMHEETGLWQDYIKATYGGALLTSSELDEELARAMSDYGVDIGTPLLGSTVSFDREILRTKFPLSFTMLSHRNVDASSIIEYSMRTLGVGFSDISDFTTEEAEYMCEQVGNSAMIQHRALYDVLVSAATWRWVRDGLAEVLCT